MSEFTANAPQTVAVNANVQFTDTVIKPCCAVTHRAGSGLFTLHGGKRYYVSFGANITSGETTTPSILALTINGEQVPATQMYATPSSTGFLVNISTATYIDVPCNCCFNLAVENVGTEEVTVQNANLIIVKEDY